MDRRQLLAHVGAGTTVAIGGCLRFVGPTDEPQGAGTPTADIRPCPPYSVDRDRVVCSHTVDTDTASVYLDPEPQTGTLAEDIPAEEITLTLYNQSATGLRFNPTSWRIHHRADADWTELEREVVGDGVVTVPPNDTYTWSFLEAVESIRDDPELDPGPHAAEIGVPDPGSDDEWVACIALVRFKSAE